MLYAVLWISIPLEAFGKCIGVSRIDSWLRRSGPLAAETVERALLAVVLQAVSPRYGVSRSQRLYHKTFINRRTIREWHGAFGPYLSPAATQLMIKQEQVLLSAYDLPPPVLVLGLSWQIHRRPSGSIVKS